MLNKSLTQNGRAARGMLSGIKKAPPEMDRASSSGRASRVALQGETRCAFGPSTGGRRGPAVNHPTSSRTLSQLPATVCEPDHTRESPAGAGSVRVYGKQGFAVHLEMRLDSKHRNVGFLALSRRCTVTSLTTACSQDRTLTTKLACRFEAQRFMPRMSLSLKLTSIATSGICVKLTLV